MDKETKSEYAKWCAQPLTREEEAAIIAKYMAELDPAALEAECKELLEKSQRGELLSFDQLLRDLGIELEEEEEPA